MQASSFRSLVKSWEWRKGDGIAAEIEELVDDDDDDDDDDDIYENEGSAIEDL